MTTNTPEARKERLSNILAMLKKEAMSRTQIAKAAGIDRSTTRNYINDLRPKIYIERWEKPRNHFSPFYRAGNLPDAEMPGDLEYLDAPELEAPKPRLHVNVIRHWLDVAFFGEYRAAFAGRNI